MCTSDPPRAVFGVLVTATTLLGAGSVQAQQAGGTQQAVRGPVATYWVTADTVSGLSALGAGGSGMGGMLGMLAGRGPGSARTLDLRLGSTQSASGAPEAAHLVPPGLAMGAQLPLVSPEPSKPARPERGERTLPEGMEQPKGRMLIYWGCGETVGPGQPVIIDFAKVGAGQAVPSLASRAVRVARAPSPATHRSWGGWPNERDSQAVPTQASLIGEHQVKSNYSPDIRFAVERHDFMAPVDLSMTRSPGGAQQMSWKAVPTATGYFMTAFGAQSGGAAGGTDVVMWSSSAVQETGGALADHVPPAEVARLVRERVVLAPDRTDCTLPAEVSKAMPAGMLSFVAYGDELNVAHPPRPQDPRVPWDLQWTVKVRLRSTSMVPLGDGMAGLMGGAARSESTGASLGASGGEARPAEAGAPPAAQGTVPGLPAGANEAIDQGVRVLRGIFGR